MNSDSVIYPVGEDPIDATTKEDMARFDGFLRRSEEVRLDPDLTPVQEEMVKELMRAAKKDPKIPKSRKYDTLVYDSTQGPYRKADWVGETPKESVMGIEGIENMGADPGDEQPESQGNTASSADTEFNVTNDPTNMMQNNEGETNDTSSEASSEPVRQEDGSDTSDSQDNPEADSGSAPEESQDSSDGDSGNAGEAEQGYNPADYTPPPAEPVPASTQSWDPEPVQGGEVSPDEGPAVDETQSEPAPESNPDQPTPQYGERESDANDAA